MTKGPKGEKRPADVVGNAVHVMRIMVDAAAPKPGRMTLARYMVRRQENGEYAVYDTKTHKPTEADGKRCFNF